MYDLAAQLLIKTLQPGIRWISSMDIHSSGDHLIVGGYDKKLCWFDLDLSDKPYKVLRYVSFMGKGICGFVAHRYSQISLACHPVFDVLSNVSAICIFL